MLKEIQSIGVFTFLGVTFSGLLHFTVERHLFKRGQFTSMI